MRNFVKIAVLGAVSLFFIQDNFLLEHELQNRSFPTFLSNKPMNRNEPLLLVLIPK